MQIHYDYFHDFLALFFPDLCAACGTTLFKNEQVICINCIHQLPVTNFHKDPENKLAKQLWGRFRFIQASSFLYFRKGGSVQNIMHQLKYNNRPEAGFRLGQLYGYQLKGWKNWINPDLIIPVPLHPIKLKQRQYNQSDHIANGIASVLNIAVLTDGLQRMENTETQTKKSRFMRYENLKDVFVCKDIKTLIDKHILLVDDIMTTGATIEACSLRLLEVEGTAVSIVTIAFTE